VLVIRDFFKLELIEAVKLGVVHAHLVCSFQQIVLQVLVARIDHSGVSGFKPAGLIFSPRQTGKLSECS